MTRSQEAQAQAQDQAERDLGCSICEHVFDNLDDLRACAHPRCHNRVCVDCRVGVVGQLGRFCLPGFHSYQAAPAEQAQNAEQTQVAQQTIATVKIQALARGHLVRKKSRHAAFVLHGTFPSGNITVQQPLPFPPDISVEDVRGELTQIVRCFSSWTVTNANGDIVLSSQQQEAEQQHVRRQRCPVPIASSESEEELEEDTSSDDVCEKCGKTEADFEGLFKGPAITMYAVNNRLWCPDCIYDDCNEEEETEESSEDEHDPVYLRYTISNGSQEEVHYVCIDEEEELEEFHAGEWDYEHFLHLQLDYNDADMAGTHDVITQAVWESHCHIIHGNCLIRSIESSEEEEPEVKDNTKNEKGNRKVVEVEYPGPVATFKIPDGLDLEDKSVVEAWWVIWGTLHISYVSGAEQHIEWEYDPEPDFKRGKESIVDADNHGVEYSEDEEGR